MTRKLSDLLKFNPDGLDHSGGVRRHVPQGVEHSEPSTPKLILPAGGLEPLSHKALSTPEETHGYRRVTPPRGVTHWRPSSDQPQDRFWTVRQQFLALKAESEVTASRENRLDIAADFTARIMAWVKTQTPAQLSAKRTINEIIRLAGLSGRTKGAASVQQAGIALRRAGFQPTRDYTKGGHNRRYWIYKD